MSVSCVGLGPVLSSESSLLSPGGSQCSRLRERRAAHSPEGGPFRSPPNTAPCALPTLRSRYSPHQDADPLKPREPAIIKHFTAYKNQDHGAWLRGGDVWLDSCR